MWKQFPSNLRKVASRKPRFPGLKMPKRKFDAKLRKVGNSHVVTIPKELINRFKIKEDYYLALELDTKEIKKGVSR